MSPRLPLLPLLLVLAVSACAPVILFEGRDPAGGGAADTGLGGSGGESGGVGVGGGGTNPGGAGAGGSGAGVVTGTFGECGIVCNGPPDNGTCACALDCVPGSPPTGKVSCAPVTDLEGTEKIRCICTVDEQFSGVCYEAHPESLCDFQEGCCAKYFSGK